MRLSDPVTSCKGIGPRTAEAFCRLGIHTAGDLLRHYPARYDTIGQVQPIAEAPEGKVVSVRGCLSAEPRVLRTGRKPAVSVAASDGSGRVSLVWFNQPYLKNVLHKGDIRIFRGTLTRNRYGLSLIQPQIFRAEDYTEIAGSMRPVYHTVKGLSGRLIASAVTQVLEEADLEPEYYPADMRRKESLAERNFALRTIHFPGNEEALKMARDRLVFDEFFFFILAMRALKSDRSKAANGFPCTAFSWSEKLISGLPYTLTEAQTEAWEDIRRDISGSAAMNRLIQGDVGSGKTVLALLSLVTAAENGYQAALMAPTEVLARQHYEKFVKLFEELSLPVCVGLLTGSMTPAQAGKVREQTAAHEIDLLIGTHALIQDSVSFARLGLVVTDEQHRFGVRQREALSQKGGEVHVLVMSATPIPRTLALILYGDLDISVIRTRPAGRLPVKNAVIRPEDRPRALKFIRNQLEQGRQAYVICPLVEESEGMQAANVADTAAELAEVFAPFRTAALHGRMRPEEKNRVMEEFSSGEIRVLVSTTVVEVGIDVPNASVMLIEGAEHFGLAQLHQLRGRIGRGKEQSYCIFLDSSGDEEENPRLAVLGRENDGFVIAEEDLKLRGPGDFFGVRQSGTLSFAIGDIYTDSAVLQRAAAAADRILAEDPGLEKEEHRQIRRKYGEFVSFLCQPGL